MLLDGKNLQGFIKERQFKRVRALRTQGTHVELAIISTSQDPATTQYLRAKQSYGEDIGAIVSVHEVDKGNISDVVTRLNQDTAVHGIIVQLPLPDGLDTETVLASVAPGKDVDGLTVGSPYPQPTPIGIMWLLGGYNIEIKDEAVLVIGQGRLVGVPIAAMLKRAGYQVETADEFTENLPEKIRAAQVIISATGQPGLVRSRDVQSDSVVIDAGTTLKDGQLVGDCERALYGRKDIKISPVPGGVGPMTVAALFENVIQAAGKSNEK